MTESLFTSETPSTTDASDGGAAGISTATTVRFTISGNVTGIRFYATTTVGGTYTAELWHVNTADPGGSGTLLASKVGSAPTGGAWNVITFTTPVSVSTGNLYRATLNNSAGRYVATAGFFASPLTTGHIVGDSNGDDPIALGSLAQGTFADNSAAGTYPANTFGATCYFVDVVFGSGFTAALGVATETDSAITLGKIKSRAVGVAAETDTALALVASKRRQLGINEETDTARALVRAAGATYLFRPPTLEEGIDTTNRLFRFFKFARGISIGVVGSTVTEIRFPYVDDIANYDFFYLGGYDHTISASEAATLTNAGYGDNIT